MKISLIQMRTLKTQSENLVKINELVARAVNDGGELVVLPEMCCCEYSNTAFKENAVKDDSDFIISLSQLAKKYGITLVAGTVPELDGDKIYNTSYVFDENGQLIAKHRKVHLFDVDIKEGISFKESDTFTSGDGFTAFNTKWGRIGLIICFDIRFPEFIKANSKELKMIIAPACFNMTTGPAHWQLLFKSRAVDNQVFMAGCAGALDKDAPYHSYGHSLVVNPWGEVVRELGFDEDILTLDIDLSEVDSVRAQLPLYK